MLSLGALSCIQHFCSSSTVLSGSVLDSEGIEVRRKDTYLHRDDITAGGKNHCVVTVCLRAARLEAKQREEFKKR